MRMVDDCRYHLVKLGISMPDADQLRRIAMTLHRWHEMECGDGNDYSSWCIVRGKAAKREFYRDPETQAGAWRTVGEFEYDDNGAPYIERHIHSEKSGKARYESIPDRERGALKRLATIMARYPALASYVQGDPRGASLYILDRATTPQPYDQFYSRGVAVHK